MASGVTLILGGARSGKSRFAQQLAMKQRSVGFIATALPSDEEMKERIARHKAERPAHWVTLEERVDVPAVIKSQASRFDLMLVDCLTLYVANLMTAENCDPGAVSRRAECLYHALENPGTTVVLVSNEVGSGVVPAHASGRVFRDLLGEVNRRVAEVADNVLLMVAGLPLVVKGRVP